MASGSPEPPRSERSLTEVQFVGRNGHRGVKPRFFYGWLMVAASFVVQAIGVGNGYLLGVFLPHFKAEFAASTADLLLCTYGAMTLAFGLLAPLYGVAAQRFSLRRLISFSILCVAAAYIGLSQATRLWQVAIIYSLLFSLGSLGAIITAPALVANWFDSSRGLALGIAAAGISAAGFAGPPLAATAIAHVGLQLTLVAVGATIALCLPIHWLIVDRPEDVGLRRDGDQSESSGDEKEKLSESAAPIALPTILRSRIFWVIAIVSSCATATISALLPTLVSIAENAGIRKQVAAYLMSTAAATAMASKVTFGWLFDRWNQRTIALVTLGLLAGASGLLTGRPDLIRLAVGSVLLGAGVGATILILNVLAAACFGRRSFIIVVGALTPLTTAMTLAALWAIGYAFDASGSYDAALLGFIAALSLSALIAFSLPASRASGTTGVGR
jgi:sugar phosphate permease